MIHKIYAVFDSKAESYTAPMIDHHEAKMLRTFSDACNDTEHTFGMHPEDYTLFDLGEYDDSTGTITQEKIISIAGGHTVQYPDLVNDGKAYNEVKK